MKLNKTLLSLSIATALCCGNAIADSQTATIVQQGVDGSATIHQQGGSNTTTISQLGDMSSGVALVNQYGQEDQSAFEPELIFEHLPTSSHYGVGGLIEVEDPIHALL